MTRRSSVRAQAREIYGELAAAQTAPPTPNPSPPFAAQMGGGEKESLTARVRALYEDSAVPVHAIAKLAGVTERTIYKYAAKGGWKPRHRRSPDVAPVKGAGGRFIRRADKGKPFAQGLKATDGQGRACALAACRVAESLARAAQAQAEAIARHEALLRVIDWTNRALADFAAFRQDRAKHRAKDRAKDRKKNRGSSPLQGEIEGILIRIVALALRRWEALQA